MLLLNEQQMERRKLVRRLETRRRELEVHEQHFKDFEEGIKEKRIKSDSLVGERQKVQQLKKRIRRLERRVRGIDRRTQNRVHARVVNYLKRVVGHLRAKLPGR
jgi:predicted RNase H-like nuclease (RuvC/YqgF family)